MSESPPSPVRNTKHHEFEREFGATSRSVEDLSIEDLKDIKLSVTADIGECVLRVRDIVNLKRGSILALGKNAGEMADIQINGVPLGKAEIVVLGDMLHVRIAEIFGAQEKDENEGA